MSIAPVAFFVYNRLWHTKQSIESLLKNDLAHQTELFIFSDAPKNLDAQNEVSQVREYIKTIKGFKNINIIKRDNNFGLANSIIDGTTRVINEKGKVVVIEDDLICSENFLKFINEMLNVYENEYKIFSVTGYNFPSNLMKIPKGYIYDIYFSPRCSSWGWGTWKNRWEKADWELKDIDNFLNDKKLQKKYRSSGNDKIDMLVAQKDGKIDSWATRWEYNQFKNNAFTVYPVKSFINNIGFDGTGVNCGFDKKYLFTEGLENNDYKLNLPEEIKLDKRIMREFKKVFDIDKHEKIKKIIKKVIFYDKWKIKK